MMVLPRPIVSVVVTCYNSEKYLHETLRSVAQQTLDDYEIIAVDDCSTDSTPEILKEYSLRDRRLRYLRHNFNSGKPAISKNTGVNEARGKYICFLDHDDLFHPQKLENSVSILEEQRDCVAAFHDIEMVESDGVQIIGRYLDGFIEYAGPFLEEFGDGKYKTKKDFFKFQLIRYAALHTISTMICPERLRQETLRFDTRYCICEDTDMWVRLGLDGTIFYTDEVLAYYRQHQSNITKNQLTWDRDAIRLIRNNYERVRDRLSVEEKRALKRRLVNQFSDYGWHARKLGRHVEAMGAYFSAFRLDPQAQHAIDMIKAAFPARS